jgi:hypothetical protein
MIIDALSVPIRRLAPPVRRTPATPVTGRSPDPTPDGISLDDRLHQPGFVGSERNPLRAISTMVLDSSPGSALENSSPSHDGDRIVR